DKEPRFILTASNLTEHINQTKTIERSERKQKQIINNISDLLLIIERHDEEILFENANDNFCNFFGVDKTKNHLAKLSEVISPDLDSLVIQSINQIVYQNQHISTFNYLYNNERHFSCKVTYINEKISAIFIITMSDKTDEINYQEQLKKAYQKEMMVNKMKSDFLANMSHEIRTPFNAIIGYSEIIDESVAENDIKMVKEIMYSMKEFLGRALNLFKNILEVSQNEAGSF
ncbi:MAG: histidine kinase dimerization/phospho-acceptor domain-containing protein, partial [Ignavibacteria bacterium]|nr:histidine kinase dimerization/phospho-acceptor domain-containing protein [Ignavibacteria bacterium]